MQKLVHLSRESERNSSVGKNKIIHPNNVHFLYTYLHRKIILKCGLNVNSFIAEEHNRALKKCSFNANETLMPF